jgi:hypothetical protein
MAASPEAVDRSDPGYNISCIDSKRTSEPLPSNLRPKISGSSSSPSAYEHFAREQMQSVLRISKEFAHQEVCIEPLCALHLFSPKSLSCS